MLLKVIDAELTLNLLFRLLLSVLCGDLKASTLNLKGSDARPYKQKVFKSESETK